MVYLWHAAAIGVTTFDEQITATGAKIYTLEAFSSKSCIVQWLYYMLEIAKLLLDLVIELVLFFLVTVFLLLLPTTTPILLVDYDLFLKVLVLVLVVVLLMILGVLHLIELLLWLRC